MLDGYQKFLKTFQKFFFVLIFLSPVYAQSSSVISAEELKAAAGSVKIVDLRDKSEFIRGHIPGAVWIDASSFADENSPVPNMLPSPAQLEAIMGNAGISDKDAVIIYSSGSNFERASRVWWILSVYGNKNVKILDGNYESWVYSKAPVQKGDVFVSPVVYKAGKKDETMIADADYILKNKDAVILDARTKVMYAGDKPVAGAKVSGHIPGAKNRFAGDNLDERGKFKDIHYLKTAYDNIGVTGDKEVIVYCNRGNWGAHTYFVIAELLGYDNVRLYDGSWVDWSSRADVPIASGE